MAGDARLNIKITSEIEGLQEVIGQLRRTGGALIGLADSLERLSEGSPDAARTVPDGCPGVINGQSHDAHTIRLGSYVYRCPGHPVRPWHADSPDKL